MIRFRRDHEDGGEAVGMFGLVALLAILVAFTEGAPDTQDPNVIPLPIRQQQWNLDKLGNWKTFTETTGGVTLTQDRAHNKVNELRSITVGPAVTDLKYDPAGNMKDDTVFHYRYDEEQRLKAVFTSVIDPLTGNRIADVALARYKYDALGRRILKRLLNADGTTLSVTRFYYDGDRVVEERTGGQNLPQKQYVWGLYVDELLISDTVDGFGNVTLSARLYALQNSTYSVHALVNDTGAVVERYSYSPYGEVTFLTAAGVPLAASAVGNNYLFTGREQDAESGLMHFRARTYDPKLGRFRQRDPGGFTDGSNLYEFVQSQPTSRTDPFGLWTFEGMLKEYLERYGDDGQRLLKYLVVQGYKIEVRSYWFNNWDYEEADGVLGMRSSFSKGGLVLGRSDAVAAIILHEALSDKYGGVVADLVSGAARIGGTSLRRAQEMKLEVPGGLKTNWTAIEARAAEAGAKMQRDIENEAMWMVGTAVGAKTAQLALARLRTWHSARKFAKSLAAEANDVLSAVGSKLHPNVPKFSGSPARGVFRHAGVDVPLKSGAPGPGATLKELPGGPGTGLNAQIPAHVEGHAAGLMHKHGLKEAELFINLPPCPTGAMCRHNLHKILPPDSKLLVHWLSEDGLTTGKWLFEHGVPGWKVVP